MQVNDLFDIDVRKTSERTILGEKVYNFCLEVNEKRKLKKRN